MLSHQELSVLMPRLKARARRLTRNGSEAEDLAQETVLRVWQRALAGCEIFDPERYAMTTLRHLSTANWRRPQMEELDETALSTPPEGPARLACSTLSDAIARLPSEQKTLMRRVLAGQTSPKDLAAETGLPLGTVMSRLARARVTLRGEIGLEAGEKVEALL